MSSKDSSSTLRSRRLAKYLARRKPLVAVHVFRSRTSRRVLGSKHRDGLSLRKVSQVPVGSDINQGRTHIKPAVGTVAYQSPWWFPTTLSEAVYDLASPRRSRSHTFHRTTTQPSNKTRGMAEQQLDSFLSCSKVRPLVDGEGYYEIPNNAVFLGCSHVGVCWSLVTQSAITRSMVNAGFGRLFVLPKRSIVKSSLPTVSDQKVTTRCRSELGLVETMTSTVSSHVASAFSAPRGEHVHSSSRFSVFCHLFSRLLETRIAMVSNCWT